MKNETPAATGQIPEGLLRLLPLLLGAVVLLTFWQCLRLPYIQDDWFLIHAFQGRRLSSLLPEFFDFRGKLMYRPAGLTYLAVLFQISTVQAWPCHLLAMGIHLLNSVLVYNILKKLSENVTLSLLSSVLYASALAIHLDTLCWGVGIYDLGGALFFFLSLWLFLSDRSLLSAFSFFVGLLFKESIIVLPFVLAALSLARSGQRTSTTYRALAGKMAPHLGIMAASLGVKFLSGASPQALPRTHPYAMSPLGTHVVKNIYRYIGWMLQSFLPVGAINSRLFQLLIAGLVIAAVLLWVRKRPANPALLIGLMLWAVFSLLPVLLLINHAYRYYAVYALPPFLFGVLYLLQTALEGVKSVRQREVALLSIGVLAVLASVVQSNRLFHQGLEARIMTEGTNELIRRGRFVEIVRSSLAVQMPHPRSGAAILFKDVDIWAFSKDIGPQTWYGDASLRVYDIKDLRYEADRFFVDNPVQSQTETYTGASAQRVPLDAENMSAYELRDGSLYPIERGELEKLAHHP